MHAESAAMPASGMRRSAFTAAVMLRASSAGVGGASKDSADRGACDE